MSNLTTHVLDTSQGKPAEGMKIQLFKIEDKKSVQLAEVITNKDGRVDQKLLKSENNIIRNLKKTEKLNIMIASTHENEEGLIISSLEKISKKYQIVS